ncbi:hypothetical protein [Phytohabitans aurantiacus]|uniref:Core-binding (CB) domain-containing protein n=1 Tax=Phytohabitans aurantiacus TaxID=3016789 RepID=A0ABQ5QW98_9ACTN|nr:hypothetical protein [Phytohabitans aurantiacus]GLH98848.1 hypothetical protein Pa4123_41230 [Phytohabitans aurantiacus]
MPRRGEHRSGFPAASAPDPHVSRIGIRQVTVPRNGQQAMKSATVVLSFRPEAFRCAGLAAELADEWVELVQVGRLREGASRSYLSAMRCFLNYVDAQVQNAATASLARAEPDLHHAVNEWVRILPSKYAPGSRMPGWHAGHVRTLIARRAEHPDRPLVGHLNGWIEGAVGVRRGGSTELDEFSRAEKKKLIRAAWAARRATEARIRAGRELAATATTSPVGDPWAVESLLAAIASDRNACEEILARLRDMNAIPPALRKLAPERSTWPAKRALVRILVSQLFLTSMDLHAYRILLMAATGRAPEEVTGLTEDDIEFHPQGVTITFAKGRAHARMRQAFSSDPAPAGMMHPAGARLDAAEILRVLLELNRPLADLVGIRPVPLFLRASVSQPSLVVGLLTRMQGPTFADWLRVHDVTVNGVADIRRLRKSTKVEKALTFGGRISDVADDHSEQTFRGHYAHGTTLRVIAGEVITTAQQRWLDKALAGPTVLDEQAAESLTDPKAAAVLGLSPAEVDALRTGQLDMGVTDCTDPFASPFGRPGQLCPVAPLRCLECRNAFVLPSNLPQLLLFADHLDQLALKLEPRHFHALWGQSRANLTEVLASRTDTELVQARQQIAENGTVLHLPLASRVEFDA